MGKLNFNGFYSRSITGLAALLIFAIVIPSVDAQPVLSAENTALGGGGTAYLTGYEAQYWNPANMGINDRQGNVHIGLGQSGILYEPVLSSDVIGQQFFNFTDSYFPYEPGAVDITPTQRETILDENYPRNRLTSQHQTRSDIILGGISCFLSAEPRYPSQNNIATRLML